jgi:hypothetical protein
MGKKVVTVFFPSRKTKEVFVLGEHFPTYTEVSGGIPVYVERHWKVSMPGEMSIYDRKQVEPAIQLNSTNAVFNSNGASFNLDQWTYSPVVGGRFELYYVVKFTDGEIAKSNTLRGQIG